LGDDRTPSSLGSEEEQMPAVEITAIGLGFDTCCLLRGDGVIAVDGGAPKKAQAFVRGLERASVRPEEVRLVVLTHAHWDYVGSAAEIKSITGAKLALHEKEIGWLEQAKMPLPPGVTPRGKVLGRVLRLIMPLIRIAAPTADLSLTDADLSLVDYGIPGRIVYTPGHTMGSVSVVLDTGEAFVGDLAMNAPPLRLSPGLPILAEDTAAVMSSWRSLLNQGVTTIYPAHGRPFSADVMRRAIAH